MTANFINPPEIFASPAYTHVVEVTGGRMVFISGQVALDAQGNIVGANDMRAQVEQVMENLKAALAAVGGDFSHVVKMTHFTVDIVEMLKHRDVRTRYFPGSQRPASSAFEVRKLFRDDCLVEVEAIAVIP